MSKVHAITGLVRRKRTLLIIPRLMTASSDLKASSISSYLVVTVEETTSTEPLFLRRSPYVWCSDIIVTRLPGHIFRVDARIVIVPSLLSVKAVDYIPVMRWSSRCGTANSLISFARVY
jgi:hypothetical protein